MENHIGDFTPDDKKPSRSLGGISRNRGDVAVLPCLVRRLEGVKIESTGGNPGVVTSYVTVPDIDSTISISDLFGLVKTFDKEFRYKSVNASILNKGGTTVITSPPHIISSHIF